MPPALVEGTPFTGRAIFRTRPTSRKGGFYLHRDGSPLVEGIPDNFHCDISAVIEQAPTPDTSPALISGRPTGGNLGGPLVCLGLVGRDVGGARSHRQSPDSRWRVARRGPSGPSTMCCPPVVRETAHNRNTPTHLECEVPDFGGPPPARWKIARGIVAVVASAT